MADEPGLTESLYIRLSKEDHDALKDLAKRMPLKVATIARLALRVGVAELAKDPSRIFASTTPAKKGSR